ncbi:MAG: spondin domain-containing protein [Flavobacteriaceae bacterium]|nr:spondin domain-containing protein [Flavobacteriaceae bacterium]
MKTITKSQKFNLLFLFLFFSIFSFGQSMATYSITFNGNWNNTDHSDNGMTPLPSNDHWSDLVGATHNPSVVFWEAGQMATLGIEDVAERGDNDAFFNEVDMAITVGNSDQWLQQGFSPNNAMGTSTIMSITVSEDFPLLTLVSMIAPSPDWFAGIHGFSLRDGNNWKDNITLDLFPYDAGTEDGTGYGTSNPATIPQDNISSLVNVAPFNDKKVATMTITLESVLNLPDNNFKSGINLSPNPTNGKVTINNSSSEIIDNIQFYDIIGKLVKSVKLDSANNETQLNLEDLSSGIYLVKVTSAKGNSSLKKLVIN